MKIAYRWCSFTSNCVDAIHIEGGRQPRRKLLFSTPSMCIAISARNRRRDTFVKIPAPILRQKTTYVTSAQVVFCAFNQSYKESYMSRKFIRFVSVLLVLSLALGSGFALIQAQDEPIKIGLSFSDFATERWKNEEVLGRKGMWRFCHDYILFLDSKLRF